MSHLADTPNVLPGGIMGRILRVDLTTETITVEPLAESGVWWSEVLAYLRDSPDPSALRPWRQLTAHFRGRPDYVDSAFVRIGDYEALHELDAAQMPKGTEVVGCVLPRIAIGLTRRGSVAGVFGYTVQT